MKNQIIYDEKYYNDRKILEYNQEYDLYLIKLSDKSSKILIEIINENENINKIDIDELIDFIKNNEINEILDNFKINDENFNLIIIER